MTTADAQTILDKIVGQVFGYKNPLTLQQFQERYAFDIRLPSQVTDATTGEATWASSINPAKFITFANAQKRVEVDDFMIPKRPVATIQDILTAWNETNYAATERSVESLNLLESDSIMRSENVYRSQDINDSKNILFSDGGFNNEFMAAMQRSNNSTFSIRVEDSRFVSDSFSVNWSNKVSKSFFINDCFDVVDCMFCSHLGGKQYCIANMQFEEAEYKKLKDIVVRWILQG
jgi:hypothetical protein